MTTTTPHDTAATSTHETATTTAATPRPPVPAPARAPTDEHGPSVAADVAPGALAEPVDAGLDRLAREIPRLGRLLTSIEELRVQVLDWVPEDAAGRRRRKRAEALLVEAGTCAAACRVDDGWAYLNAADRTALPRLDDESLTLLADRLRVECAAKLTGWRAEAAALSLAATDETDRTGLLSRLTAAQQMLDDYSQKTYLRLRLLGRRVAVATALLALAMAALSTMVVVGPAGWVGVLGDRAMFAQVVLLGALGAMLSAAISAMDHGSAPRVYELSTPLLATAVARVLTGSAAAVVTVMAAEVGLLPVEEDWLPMVAVVSGFSERLVRRVVATLSDAAEHKASAPARA